MKANPDSRLIAALCLAQVAGMLGLSTFSTLLPELIEEWRLTNTEAGWLNGILFGGYAGAVLFLMGLTDRFDARRIFLACCILSSLSMAAFAWYAEGFWSAMALRALSPPLPEIGPYRKAQDGHERQNSDQRDDAGYGVGRPDLYREVRRRVAQIAADRYR